MSTQWQVIESETLAGGENRLAAIFPDRKAALSAIAALTSPDLGSEPVRLVERGGRAAGDGDQQKPGKRPGVVEELGRVLGESFSDDEKFTATIDRALAQGASVLEMDLKERDQERESLAASLKQSGAVAVFYWGPMTSERL